MTDEYLTDAEVALRLKQDKSKIQRAMRAGQLRARKVGRSWITTSADVDAWLETCIPATTTARQLSSAITGVHPITGRRTRRRAA